MSDNQSNEPSNPIRFLSSDICRTETDSVRDGQTSHKSADIRGSLFQSNARSWWKVDILVNALSALNFPVSIEQVSDTRSESSIVYSCDTNTIMINPSKFVTPFGYRRALTRGLVYAFDNARAKLDYDNVDHLPGKL